MHLYKMKKFLPLAFLLLAGCGPDKQTQARLDKMDDRLVTLENAQTNNNTRLDLIEQEQTFQYKDIDSTKRALGSIALVAMEAHGVAVKVDSTVKLGRDKAGKRTAVVMEAASWIPFLAPFIKKR
jgi:hypothetical protein